MPSISHISAGFSLGFAHRKALYQLLAATPENCSVLQLDPDQLFSSGVEALALDFDGVLAAHGAPTPLPETIEWMKLCEAVFGGSRIFILSNKPTEERRRWFTEHFPAMRFISGVRKKPYPDGLLKTAELAGVTLSRVLMVDDRLLTGCLAALVAGARPCYIRNPYVSFGDHMFSEAFFGSIRWVERVLIKCLG
ncbi:MAG: hypothetical protein PHN84_06025 [Desulfuromonadaceae bacterium]|nr:hypothetical protein [Desulfuromonadaceae bacterium]MDD2856107.1 hypothetical protein [Desulfuromonadaceae bacterium]